MSKRTPIDLTEETSRAAKRVMKDNDAAPTSIKRARSHSVDFKVDLMTASWFRTAAMDVMPPASPSMDLMRLDNRTIAKNLTETLSGFVHERTRFAQKQLSEVCASRQCTFVLLLPLDLDTDIPNEGALARLWSAASGCAETTALYVYGHGHARRENIFLMSPTWDHVPRNPTLASVVSSRVYEHLCSPITALACVCARRGWPLTAEIFRVVLKCLVHDKAEVKVRLAPMKTISEFPQSVVLSPTPMVALQLVMAYWLRVVSCCWSGNGRVIASLLRDVLEDDGPYGEATMLRVERSLFHYQNTVASAPPLSSGLVIDPCASIRDTAATVVQSSRVFLSDRPLPTGLDDDVDSRTVVLEASVRAAVLVGKHLRFELVVTSPEEYDGLGFDWASGAESARRARGEITSTGVYVLPRSNRGRVRRRWEPAYYSRFPVLELPAHFASN